MIKKVKQVNNPKKKYLPRDLDLAAKVAKMEDDALVGTWEVSAFTGIARSSFHKKLQREKIGLPAPSRIGGRHLVWSLGVIRRWASRETSADPVLILTKRVGRPTKMQELARSGLI